MMFYGYTIEDALPKIHAMGFDAVEIWAEHLWRRNEDPLRIARLLGKNNLRCSVHCPIMDLNITSPNRGIRAESIRQTLASVELTHELNAEMLVVHPGALYTVKNSLDDYWEWLLDASEQVVEQGRRWGVHLALENMDVQSKVEVVKTAQDILRVTDHFAPGELGVVLDTTHLGTTERILEFVKGVPEIHHVHISDAVVVSAEQVRTHLVIGAGTLDFPRVLGAIVPKLRGILSLETFIPPGNDDRIRKQKAYLDTTLAALDLATS
jgi:sugar phosphate isomerase/epimerase